MWGGATRIKPHMKLKNALIVQENLRWGKTGDLHNCAWPESTVKRATWSESKHDAVCESTHTLLHGVPPQASPKHNAISMSHMTRHVPASACAPESRGRGSWHRMLTVCLGMHLQTPAPSAARECRSLRTQQLQTRDGVNLWHVFGREWAARNGDVAATQELTRSVAEPGRHKAVPGSPIPPDRRRRISPLALPACPPPAAPAHPLFVSRRNGGPAESAPAGRLIQSCEHRTVRSHHPFRHPTAREIRPSGLRSARRPASAAPPPPYGCDDLVPCRHPRRLPQIPRP